MAWQNDGKWQGGDGFWWRVDIGDESNYASVIRVLDCYATDLPDNVFIVESGTLSLADSHYEKALCGESPSDELNDRIHTINGYFGFDNDSFNGESVYAIGKVDLKYLSHDAVDMWERLADSAIMLHGNTKRGKFIHNEFLNN